MPIVQLEAPSSLPIIGYLRKGAPKEPNRPGKDLSYFRFTSDFPGLEERFAQVYGPEPQLIDCRLPVDDIDTAWVTWMEQWSNTRGLVRRCDGKRIVYVTDDESGAGGPVQDGQIMQCTGATTGCQCTPRGRLDLLIRGLGRDGAVRLQTGSKHDILAINASMSLLRDRAREHHFRPSALDLQLHRIMRYISERYERGGQTFKRRVQKWLVQIETHPDQLKHIAWHQPFDRQLDSGDPRPKALPPEAAPTPAAPKALPQQAASPPPPEEAASHPPPEAAPEAFPQEAEPPPPPEPEEPPFETEADAHIWDVYARGFQPPKEETLWAIQGITLRRRIRSISDPHDEVRIIREIQQMVKASPDLSPEQREASTASAIAAIKTGHVNMAEFQLVTYIAAINAKHLQGD
ncbi:MAG: hypothetical protein OXQ29_19610 [Rhodospirillaceae bacterium]|nr:hypothetical protein [Rhodospirillaceae bacterium]